MFSEKLIALAEDVISACRERELQLATAESCTGGLIAGCLTAVSGASDVLHHGFVTYANEAKINLLEVPEELILNKGAVSESVSRAMAEGALSTGEANLAVSVTGIAGPGGGSQEKPVGLVHISVARTQCETLHQQFVFDGDRNSVRLQTVEAALILLLKSVRD